jgi:hypothetical protein
MEINSDKDFSKYPHNHPVSIRIMFIQRGGFPPIVPFRSIECKLPAKSKLRVKFQPEKG